MKTSKLDGACVSNIATGFAEERTVELYTVPTGTAEMVSLSKASYFCTVEKPGTPPE